MRYALTFAVAISAYSSQSQACNPYYSVDGFNVARQRRIPAYQSDGTPTDTGLTREQYDAVLDRFQTLYTPEVERQGGEFEIVRDWDNEEVNSYARRVDNKWRILMLGGYARHELTDEDALIALACHEVGHHLGGTPHYEMEGWLWTTAEGQADYYSTLKCMRFIMENDDNEAIVAKLQVPPIVEEKCGQTWSDRKDQLICQRSAIAGYKMTQVWDDGRGNYKFDTPATEVVEKTSYWHPQHQCRVDTYFNGAICAVDKAEQLSNESALAGACNTPEFTEGFRPLCWYHPG